MPTRIITSSPVKVTGTAPDGQEFESTIEEDFFLLLRFNLLVESFTSQPITVEWQDAEGKIRSYTPDVLVRYRNDLAESANWPPVLCEVKPDLNDQTKSPRRRKPPRTENEAENQLKWDAATRYSARQGWEFKVFRESEIRTPYLKNARFLLRYLERHETSKHEAPLLAWLAARSGATLGEWAAMEGGTSEARVTMLPTCYRLIALRTVEVDLSELLTLQSVVKAVANA